MYWQIGLTFRLKTATQDPKSDGLFSSPSKYDERRTSPGCPDRLNHGLH